MNWYAAHIIMYFRYKDGVQNSYSLWENIVLIHAASPEKAQNAAMEIGASQAGDSEGTLQWGGRPAYLEFAGVRKVVLCEDSDRVPGHGTEVSYSEMEVDSLEVLQQFVKGQEIELRNYR